jgi:hypothetical protein
VALLVHGVSLDRQVLQRLRRVFDGGLSQSRSFQTEFRIAAIASRPLPKMMLLDGFRSAPYCDPVLHHTAAKKAHPAKAGAAKPRVLASSAFICGESTTAGLPNRQLGICFFARRGVPGDLNDHCVARDCVPRLPIHRANPRCRRFCVPSRP